MHPISRLFRRPTSRKPHPVKLACEALEDRAVPATLTIAAISHAYEGGADGVFRVTRTGDTTNELHFIAEPSGTAVGDADYNFDGNSPALPYTYFLIPAGQSSVDIPVTVLDDWDTEANETVTLTLLPYVDVDVGTPGSATVNIHDDEISEVFVVAMADPVEGGQNGHFRVYRFGDLSQELTVAFTHTGTATAGTDYTSATSVTFGANAGVADVFITAPEDGIWDPAETVIVTIPSGSGYTPGDPASATLTIIDPPTGSIVGAVWNDANGDGTRDTGETVASGVEVRLYLDSATVQVTTTDEDGEYLFPDLGSGAYEVFFVLSPGQALSTLTAGHLDVTLGVNQAVTVADAGVAAGSGTGSIGDLVWYDSDANGMLDTGEVGAVGAVVELYSGSGGVPVAVTTTNSAGHYSFSALAAGVYTISVTPPFGSEFAGAATGIVEVTLATGQAYAAANVGLENFAGVASITLGQPGELVGGIAGAGTYDKADATFVSITLFAAAATNGKVYSKVITTQPGNNNWVAIVTGLPKGKYTVWAVMKLEKGGRPFHVITANVYKDVEFTQGQPDNTTSGVWWKALSPELGYTTKLNYIMGGATVSAPQGYDLDSVSATLSRTDGGFVSTFQMMRDSSQPPSSGAYVIRELQPGSLTSSDPWYIPKDAVGTKYRVSVVATFKKGNDTVTYMSTFIELEVKE